MDSPIKTNATGFKTGVHSSRLNDSKYFLRSASKKTNNVSRKQGIYLKFMSKSTTAKALDFTRNISRNDTIQYSGIGRFKQANVSKLQTSQLNGRKVNDASTFVPEQTRNNDTRNDASSLVPELTRNNDTRKEASTFVPELSRHNDTRNPRATKRTDVSISVSNYSPRVVLSDIRKNGVLERDNEGFAIPSMPVQRVKTIADKMEEQKKRAILSMSDCLDRLSVAQVEAFYLLMRAHDEVLNHARRTAAKQVIVSNGLQHNKDLEIANWLHNTSRNVIGIGCGGSTILAPDYAPSVVQPAESLVQHMVSGLAAPHEPQRLSVYLLKNWTLVKDSEPRDVKLLGDLYDLHSQGLIEKKHASSKVIKADGIHIQTSCCMYKLIPPFQDNNNSIPTGVKQYFLGGRFPPNWSDVIHMWHLLNAAPMATYDTDSTQADKERMSIRVPAERDGVISDREKRIVADGERRRALAERERSERLAEEQEGRALQRRGKPEDSFMAVDELPERDTQRREPEARTNGTSNKPAATTFIANVANSVSRRGRKRTSNSRYENDIDNKRSRVDLRNRIKTPIPSGRPSLIGYRTRSAKKGHRPESFLITPKSSKVNKYKNRQKTPGPQLGRRLIQDDSLSTDSDSL